VKRLLWIVLALLALGAVPPALAGPGEESVSAAAAGEMRILVMLRLSPDHYRPNTSYGGAYGDRQTNRARHRLAERVARRTGLSLVEEGWPMPLLGVDCYVMRVPEGMAVEEAIARVSREPEVAWSQPMQTYRAMGGDSRGADPLFQTQPAAAAWRLGDLHRIATGRGSTIAVVDSRIDVAHPDLAGQFVANLDFVGGRGSAPERHGTGVAGVIAAKEDNGVGIAGIAPDARLMALRACWQSDSSPGAATLCNSLSLARALQFAIQRNAGVINLSLSGPPDRLLGQLLAAALARRITVVAAFDPDLPKGGFPASVPGVIAVANESLPRFPAGVYGAPGSDVPTTQPGGRWYLVNGSSYAAAHVTGLIALVRERHSAPARLVASQASGGVVDACASLLGASASCDCSCALARAAPRARR
jgi:subtilisin family serine protease